MSKKIAVIGSGISGLGAAWHLHNNGYEVTIFEKNDYIGGHSNTVQIKGHPPIDTGFIVFNELTYPNLIALFDKLGVRVTRSDMSYGISLENGRKEYSSNNVFGDISKLFKPWYYRMLIDLVRFYKTAPTFLNNPDPSLNLGDYLKQKKYSQSFIDNHIFPMGAAIWSMSTQEMQGFPALTFIRFFVNHGLFNLIKRPQWFTVYNGSREYVHKLTAKFRKHIHLNQPIKKVIPNNDIVEVVTSQGDSYYFDHVVIASHSDQAVTMLSDECQDQKDLLQNIQYSKNTAYLHTDESFMPVDKANWASWNSMRNDGDHVCLTYWMNKLQPHLSDKKDYFVTLNPDRDIDADKVLKRVSYEHPCYTQSAIESQANIKTIQGKDNIWFCGAWCGYGFHEDGLTSGLKIAEAISGKERPWNIEEKSSSAINTI